jgi:anti-sigma regulatory factor (Ser/Thr protein kinase)
VAGIELNLTLQRDRAAARMARAALVPLHRELGDEHFSDLRVVVSELVANATVHGAGEDIRLSVSVEDDGCVSGMVEGGAPIKEISPIANLGESEEGLGLLIVDTLASSWGIDAAHHAIWFEIDPPAIAIPAATTIRQLGDELAGLCARAYGDAPRSAEVFVADDAVVVLMAGVSPEAVEGDEDEIDASFRAAVERIVGRSVISLSSFAGVEASSLCQVFRLAPLRSSSNWVGARS